MTEVKVTRREFGILAGAAAATAAGAAPAIAQGRSRLVVIGGGAGGATVAHYVKKGAPDIDVTLIEPNEVYTTCFYSNLYVGGFRSFDSITQTYDALRGRIGVDVVHDRAVGVDPAARTVRLAGGDTLRYDKLVVAPGIDFKYETIEGYDEAATRVMPHAYQAGPQTLHLKKQLLAMDDGGTVIICPPPNPFRCPPGPYERTSMIAHYLKANKPKSKILVLDAKNKFSKQGLFQEGWSRFYDGMIEWLPLDITGGLKSVDTKAMTVTTGGDTHKGAVINVIPPQKAGKIAFAAGLTNSSGWCSINPATMESTIHKNIHVVGDSAIAAAMPKSAFAANSQAKVCAMAILVGLAGKRQMTPRFRNTCWSLIAPDYSVKVGASYKAGASKIEPTSKFVSKVGEADSIRAANVGEADGWYAGFVKDIFG